MTPRYWLTKDGNLITIEYTTNRLVARIETSNGDVRSTHSNGSTTSHATQDQAVAYALYMVGGLPQELVKL